MKLIKGEFKEKLDLLLAPAIRAGFPSPAEDYLSDSLDFNSGAETAYSAYPRASCPNGYR